MKQFSNPFFDNTDTSISKNKIYIFLSFSKTGQDNYYDCLQSFLFSMVNPHGLAPSKMPLFTSDQENAIYCDSSNGPTFGGGHDLRISHDANKVTHSKSNLGNTYQCPTGHQSTFFTGARNFIVTDYEVFGIHQ